MLEPHQEELRRQIGTMPISRNEKALMNTSKFKKYLIYDGEHAASIQIKKAEEMCDCGANAILLKDALQRIYRFPNGMGACIERGGFTFNHWEVSLVQFAKEGESGDRVRGGLYMKDAPLVSRHFDQLFIFDSWDEVDEFLGKVTKIRT